MRKLYSIGVTNENDKFVIIMISQWKGIQYGVVTGGGYENPLSIFHPGLQHVDIYCGCVRKSTKLCQT